MRKKMLAAFAAAALAAAPALAEPWTKGYGGSGADRLTELVEYEGGLIAVGQTSSEDGDLETRTRSNQAGWMMRLNEAGTPLWSCCTAKNGRNRMRALYAHENGQISAALQGEGVEGFEWLIVSGEGKIVRRIEVPEIEAVCAHGGGKMFARFYDRDGEPHAALIVRHEDETCCVADMDAAGRVSRGLSFVVCMETSFAPCADGSGRVAMFLIGNSMFYIPLTFVNVVRFTIQGMGFSTFAILAGVCEMAARSLVGFCLVPVFGFLPACFASPLAWIFADAFLIPAFFHCMKKLKVLFGEAA